MCVCSALLSEQLYINFFIKVLPKSCNYHFIFARQNPVGAPVFLGAGREVWTWGQRGRFRHCRLVWAADCVPCRPRWVNLWHTGFLAPPIPPCLGALCSVPRGRGAPPPGNPAPPSYAACTCGGKNAWVGFKGFCSLASSSMSGERVSQLTHPSSKITCRVHWAALLLTTTPTNVIETISMHIPFHTEVMK